MIDRHTEQVVGEAREPAFKEFMAATIQPMQKGAATDEILKGVWQLSPYYVMQTLYLGVVWAWKGGTTPAHWVAAKLTRMEGRHNAGPLGGGKTNAADVQKGGDDRGCELRTHLC